MGAGDVGLAAFPVELFHLVGRALHHVDGAFVQGQRGGRIVHLGDDLLLAVGLVHHHEVAVGHRAQAHRIGRVAVGDPLPAVAFLVHHFALGQRLQEHRRVHRAERLAGDEGQLERGAADVVEQDQRLVRGDTGVFRRGIGEEVRVPHHVLVQRLRTGHQHAQRRLLATSGAAEALPGGGDAAGVAVEHHHVQRADVHAQFQRRGGDDAVDAAGAHRPLGLAALAGQVAAAVGADTRRLARVVVEDVLQVLGQHLHHQPRLREHQGLEPGLDRDARDAVALRARRGAQAQVGVDHRRVPQQHVLVAAGRAGVGDRVHTLLDQRLGVSARVADGGRAQDELRRDAVERADALEPAQHVGDVAAEHAAVGVDLVDHHIAQVLEELRPLGVMRQDRLVQHVRVADHDVAVQADRLARIAGGVAVEGEGLHPEVAGTVEVQQLGHLVLRQRLGREQVQRLGLRGHRRGHHRQRVAQRLARGGGGDDGHVLAALRRVPGLGLVAVQLRDAAFAQRGGQRRRHVVRDRRVAAGLAGDGEAAGDAVVVTALQPRAEQGAIARGQPVGGGQGALGVLGARG
ncbi:hypothetical protein NB705_003199 [Xanthomonas sacchari]|nr:hypothetical protein [Xanthomonas sacchari]